MFVPAGWFCGTIPSVSRFSELEVLLPGAAGWSALSIPSSIKALVFVNLQSYGGGRNIWGERVSSKKHFQPPAVNDGLIEVRITPQLCSLRGAPPGGLVLRAWWLEGGVSGTMIGVYRHIVCF